MKNLLILIFCFYAALLSAQTDAKCNKEIKCDSVFITVEKMPQFRGGETEMFKFIYENLESLQLKEGEIPATRATVRFIVRKTGKIENVKAIGVFKDTDFAKSLVKVVESMPDWCAGKNKGQPVDVYYTLPINIHIRNQ